jgi:hypothetical protein
MSWASYRGPDPLPVAEALVRGVRLRAGPRCRAGLFGELLFANEPPVDPARADRVSLSTGAVTE